MDRRLIISRTSHPDKAEELLRIVDRDKIPYSLPEDVLINLLGSSIFAYREISRDPQIISNLRFIRDTHTSFHLEEREFLRLPEEDFLKLLRLWRKRHYLEIIASDISGILSVRDTTYLLSILAVEALRITYSYYFNAMFPDMTSYVQNSGFFIIAMGKLGGMELNFSSDIDIIFMYERNEDSRKIEERTGKALEELYSKLATRIKRALDKKTEDGFVFRTDLRLRPAGEKGPLVPSTEFALNYYEQYGETWERNAYLKASVVAGDLAAGNRFLKRLEPFIYRRSLDYTTIEDLRTIKAKIDKEARWRSQKGWNVKLGEGGIREIEFMVQTLQLIFGGKKKNLRGQNTFRVLPQLYREELISRDEFHKLFMGYNFLRRLENSIQMEFDTQTQLLEEENEEKLLQIARRIGYKEESSEALKNFRRDLLRHRSNVSNIFRTFFKETKTEEDPYYPIISMEITDEELDEFISTRLNFLSREKGERLVSLLRTGGKKWIPPANLKYLHRTMSLLIEGLKNSPDPEETFNNLEKFLSKVIYHKNFMALLSENKGVARFLLKLFGTSNYLSNLFINHPELLDTLVLSSYTKLTKSLEEYNREIAAIINELSDTEAILNELRRYKNSETLRIGIHDIGGKIGILSVTRQLSDLAQALLTNTIGIVEEELIKRYGRPTDASGNPSRLLTIAMGKLGGRELNYHSDLDLIFVYTHHGETTGPRKISNMEFYTRLVQKLITYLTVPTREGKLYEIDMRLRPSGKAGPLVTSLSSFREYHSREAAIWEKLALTKARILNEGEEAHLLQTIIKKAITGSSITGEDKREILRIRKRMEEELSSGDNDIKYSPGGIVDIEFLLQYLILKKGGEFPSIVQQNTWMGLREVKKFEIIPRREVSTLQRAYVFYRFLENRLRLMKDHASDTLPGNEEDLNKLARRMGYNGSSSGQTMYRRFLDYKEQVREIFNKTFNQL